MGQVIYLRDHRRTKRTSLSTPATARVGDVMIEGEVRDISGLGLFFQPATAYVDGRFVQGPDIVECLEEDDTVEVTIMTPAGMPACILSATIRWMGESSVHGVVGFGVEFLQASVEEPCRMVA